MKNSYSYKNLSSFFFKKIFLLWLLYFLLLFFIELVVNKKYKVEYEFNFDDKILFTNGFTLIGIHESNFKYYLFIKNYITDSKNKKCLDINFIQKYLNIFLETFPIVFDIEHALAPTMLDVGKGSFELSNFIFSHLHKPFFYSDSNNNLIVSTRSSLKSYNLKNLELLKKNSKNMFNEIMKNELSFKFNEIKKNTLNILSKKNIFFQPNIDQYLILYEEIKASDIVKVNNSSSIQNKNIKDFPWDNSVKIKNLIDRNIITNIENFNIEKCFYDFDNIINLSNKLNYDFPKFTFELVNSGEIKYDNRVSLIITVPIILFFSFLLTFISLLFYLNYKENNESH